MQCPSNLPKGNGQYILQKNGQFVVPYFDDIIVFSKSIEEHKRHLEVVLVHMRVAGLVLNRKKCKFLRGSLNTLGNIVSQKIIRSDPNKVAAIVNWVELKIIQ